MKTIRISGGSDDIIELAGDISEGFYPPDADKGSKIAFSDGTVIHAHYADDGCWRVHRIATGTAGYAKTEAEGPDTDNYSDTVTLTGDIRWCLFGDEFCKIK